MKRIIKNRQQVAFTSQTLFFSLGKASNFDELTTCRHSSLLERRKCGHDCYSAAVKLCVIRQLIIFCCFQWNVIAVWIRMSARVCVARACKCVFWPASGDGNNECRCMTCDPAWTAQRPTVPSVSAARHSFITYSSNICFNVPSAGPTRRSDLETFSLQD